jgi:RimJ/RimL family protein N-acetyltransferase
MSSSLFETDLIRFRPFRKEDIDLLNEYLNHPDLIGKKNLPWGLSEFIPLSRLQIEDIHKKWLDKKKGFVLAIEEVSSSAFLGHIEFDYGWDTLQPSISITITPSRQRKHFGTAALQLGLEYIFNNLPAMQVNCWVSDYNSIGVQFAEKNGFKQRGKMRRVGFFKGNFYDIIVFDMLKTEWRSQ